MTRILACMAVLLSLSCVTKRFELPEGVGSFRVELLSIDPFARPEGCESDFGTAACPRPFVDKDSPVRVRLRAVALDRRTHEMDYNGLALVDIRPGIIRGVPSTNPADEDGIDDKGPAGLGALPFVNGVMEVELYIANGSGPTRFWVEDCGAPLAPGSFATGVSAPIYFDKPRIDQINRVTDDNTTSPLIPRADNVCAISGDPRYGQIADEDGVVEFGGPSRGGRVNVPPPAIGNFVEVVGCTREEYDARVAVDEACERGPLIVTGVSEIGFYVTDMHPDSFPEINSAGQTVQGFNNIFAFTFNFPEGLEVGNILTSLLGSPVEFSGTTQLANPLWQAADERQHLDIMPKAWHVMPDVYRNATRTYGRNESDNMGLERLEGALVCFDNLAPASVFRACDGNNSGSIERSGCLIGFDEPLPPLCEEGASLAPTAPDCDEGSRRPYCLPFDAEELESCGLRGYVPSNAFEYCCERSCYNDIDCSEEASFIGFGQWAAEVNGRYVGGDSEPVKIAVITRDAQPDFAPLEFGLAQRALPPAQQQTVRVIGNLRHVLAARPVWVLVARTPSDIEVGGECPPLPDPTP